jgi:hypothetical protein
MKLRMGLEGRYDDLSRDSMLGRREYLGEDGDLETGRIFGVVFERAGNGHKLTLSQLRW